MSVSTLKSTKQYSMLFRDFYIVGGGYLRLYRKRKKHDQHLHTYTFRLDDTNNNAIISGPEWNRYAPLIVEYIINKYKVNAITLDRRYAW